MIFEYIFFQNYLVSGLPLKAQYHISSNITSHVISIQSHNSITSTIIFPSMNRKTYIICELYFAAATVDADNNRIPNANPSLWEVFYEADHSTTKLSNHFRVKHREDYSDEDEADKRISNGSRMKDHVTYGGDFMAAFIRWAINSFKPISTVDDSLFRNMCEAYNNKGSFRGHLCRSTVMAKIYLSLLEYTVHITSHTVLLY